MTSTQNPTGSPIRRGARFVHRRHLGPDYRTPATCIVTAVRNGFVFYHDEPDGMRCKASIAPKSHTRYAGFEAEEVAEWLATEGGGDALVVEDDAWPLAGTRDTYIDGVLRNDLTTKQWIAVCLGIEADETN